MPPGVQDRTVRVTGADLEQLMRATALILTKLSQNPNYSRFTSTSVSYGGYSANYGGNYGGRNTAAGPPPEVPTLCCHPAGPQDVRARRHDVHALSHAPCGLDAGV